MQFERNYTFDVRFKTKFMALFLVFYFASFTVSCMLFPLSCDMVFWTLFDYYVFVWIVFHLYLILYVLGLSISYFLWFFNTIVSNHFRSVKSLLFSSAIPRDFDGMLGTGLPVSMSTTKRPIDMRRFSVPQLKELLAFSVKDRIN